LLLVVAQVGVVEEVQEVLACVSEMGIWNALVSLGMRLLKLPEKVVSLDMMVHVFKHVSRCYYYTLNAELTLPRADSFSVLGIESSSRLLHHPAHFGLRVRLGLEAVVRSAVHMPLEVDREL
jgi:hypothetical protein